MFKASLISMLSLVTMIGCGDETPSDEALLNRTNSSRKTCQKQSGSSKTGSRTIDG